MCGGARSTHDGLSGHIVGVHIKEQVGIFAEEIVTTDTLGRRTGPRTRHTVEEKLRIVEETRARGASVATVARRHHVNPNQVFAWRQLYRRGLLHPQAAKGDANGHSIVLHGRVDTEALSRVIDLLVQR
jgi:transposase-like protein